MCMRRKHNRFHLYYIFSRMRANSAKKEPPLGLEHSVKLSMLELIHIVVPNAARI